MADPILSLRGITRAFPSGERMVKVLDGIDLDIAAGEMVAIIGASGSGKSTLMNIIGCLDRPSDGSYHVAGRETAALEGDELAALRREYFGFIFQRYQLLGELTALGNVEIPAIYAGQPASAREARAAEILARLGMGERLDFRPGQLSGGQQQRVSIARALMNGGEVILADEPTGALDSHSGEEVLRILEELNAEGRTVIIVTHDMAVARRAHRIVEIKDGHIIADSGPAERAGEAAAARAAAARAGRGRIGGLLDRLGEAFRMAVLAMITHRLRTFLTMLGIIIGIASVVSVVALGQGSQQRVLKDISQLGTNTLQIMPGRSFGDVRSGQVTTLVVADAAALAREPYAAAVTPTVQTTAVARVGSIEASVSVMGVGAQYFDARGITLESGDFFDKSSVTSYALDVDIDATTVTTLFPDGTDPIGQVIFIGDVPARVIGVTAAQQGGFGGGSSLTVFLPYTTVQARILGTTTLRSIMLRVADGTPMDVAEQEVIQLLTRRHGSKDFFIINTDEIRQTITSTTQTLTLLVAAIALISLIVGGIGVMNIMLVSVSERVSEIGVRMAVGARRSDILSQFLIEAVLVCLVGGLLGIGLALGFGVVFAQFVKSFQLVYSTSSIAVAFLTSTALGIVFGYLPARGASRLDPIAALARD